METLERDQLAVNNLFRTLLGVQSEPVSYPPQKHLVRTIENDPTGGREKYDGYRWRRVCESDEVICTNFAQKNGICQKHNTQRRNRILGLPPKKKTKKSKSCLPYPTMVSMQQDDDMDDDMEIIEVFHKSPNKRRTTIPAVKAEVPDFYSFDIDQLNDFDQPYPTNTIKMESRDPQATTSRSCDQNNDIEYISSKKIRSNRFHVDELIAKNIPPLTDFEEKHLITTLMRLYPTSCSMLDARIWVQNEAVRIVQGNYQQKIENIAPEYFYDLLFRHPHVPIHYKNWFIRCKPMPPNTGCSIDTKVWALSMMVRGSLGINDIDEA